MDYRKQYQNNVVNKLINESNLLSYSSALYQPLNQSLVDQGDKVIVKQKNGNKIVGTLSGNCVVTRFGSVQIGLHDLIRHASDEIRKGRINDIMCDGLRYDMWIGEKNHLILPYEKLDVYHSLLCSLRGESRQKVFHQFLMSDIW